MEDYRVQLDFYDGPMDLLLYLVRRNEVDIGDIPIARITEQYRRHVELLRAIDINLAGEFVVMAAWLMEIKTRLLLPSGPAAPPDGAEGETSAADALADPRAELVRQLLAYKQFKGLADELGEAAAAQALKHPRAGIDWASLAGPDEEPAVDLADVQIWDLFDAFGRLMEATGRTAPHQITYDDTPIHQHAAHILDLLAREGPVDFEHLFEGRAKSQLIGLFLALLELIRRKQIVVRQDRPFATIFLMLRDQAEPPPARPGRGSSSRPPRRRRRRRDQRVGVTWVEPEEKGPQSQPTGTGDPDEESLDQELRAIDEELGSIRVPEVAPGPDESTPRPDGEAPPERSG